MKKEKFELKIFMESKTYRMVLFAFVAICLTIGIICFQYYKRLQDTVTAESNSYLQEIAKHVGDNASKTIHDNFAVLGTISTVLKNAKVETYQQLEPIIQAQQNYWNFESVLIVDEDGVAYDAYGRRVTLSSEDYLREVLIQKTRSMSSSQLVNNKECILWAIPIDNMQIEGKEICALVATYDLNAFDQILSVNAFDGQGYAHIITKEGGMVIRSSARNAVEMGYNVLNTINNASFEKGDSIENIKQNIEQGNSGITMLQMNGRREYMVYTPLATQEWCLITFVPASVVNAKSESLLRVTILMCILITLSFAMLTAYLMLSSFRHRTRLEQIAYVDPVTGGNTIQKFYEQAQDLLNNPEKPQFALIYTNVEKFKVFNEQFGRRACDDMLCAIEYGIQQNLEDNEVVGRLFADNFCIWVEYTDERTLKVRFNHWYEAARGYVERTDSVWLMPIMEFGVYVVSNDMIPFSSMVDRAKLSLANTILEIQGKMRYAIYDDATRKHLFREKHLEDLMESALEKGEFKVYIQPKYRTSDEKVGGAEALVRWKNDAEGMIYPDEFISLFEKNGFILQLDLWVFEKVCQTIRVWLDAGYKPPKVSVNCSRVHLKNPTFLNQYIEICECCNVSPSHLEIELTENVVFENVEYLIQIINEIHNAGFGCSMDDFGSGYSSLNMIQNIPVDTIKLDKVFFQNGSGNLERSESVIGGILTMAKALHLETVAEGVEERNQVDMLKRLGCDYIQGYFFAKPMPILEFEELAFGEVVPN